jgi:hypothetical protein
MCINLSKAFHRITHSLEGPSTVDSNYAVKHYLKLGVEEIVTIEPYLVCKYHPWKSKDEQNISVTN